MPTLYRKYRPQKFSNEVGQEHIIKTITNEIAANKVAHAYLFSGPRGVGKTTTARLLAKAVNCYNRKDGEYEPCEKCVSCEEITAGRSIDVIEIDAASQTGVDNVRENIIENAQFKPTRSKYKVFIIDEVHMLSTSAFNALLKTLEEPPAHVIFILATTELHKLPETIISRCQRFNFKKIPYEVMLKRLKEISKEEGVKVEDDVFDRIIQKSEGCMRDAESLLGQVFSLNLKSIKAEDVNIILPITDAKSVLDFIENLVKKNSKQALTTIDKLVEDGASIDNFMLELIEALRAIMIFQTGLEIATAEYSSDAKKVIKNIAKEVTPQEITRLIETAIKRKQEIKYAPVPQLPLEIMAVEAANGTNHENTRNNDTPPPPPQAPRRIAQAEPPKKADTNNNVVATATQPEEYKTVKQSIQSAISNITGHHTVKTSLDTIKAKWDDVVNKISDTNHSLTFILKMCNLVRIEDGNLCISVPFTLHKEKIDEAKNKKALEECMFAIFGENICIHCEICADKTSTPSDSSTSDSEINNLAAQFGGEVVG